MLRGNRIFTATPTASPSSLLGIMSSSLLAHQRVRSNMVVAPSSCSGLLSLRYKSTKTGILFLNLGGPKNLDEVEPFLLRLFSDEDIIPLPFQKYTAKFISKRRTGSIQEQYKQIGGGSPILSWTEKQAAGMISILEKELPELAPYKSYIGFRYASPLTEETVKQILQDKVERVIVFTQYPQYSCSTTGSSFNEIDRVRKLYASEIANGPVWSFIDRWPTHKGLIDAFVDRIQQAIETKYTEEQRKDLILLFSAHSLPLVVVNRGDTYSQEVAATVQAVMERFQFRYPFRLVWQSKVGPQAWLGPSTESILEGYAKQNKKNVLMVPIAFTSDHVETLYELDLEYGEHFRKEGITNLHRIESLNDGPIFLNALADLVMKHAKSGQVCSSQLLARCAGCKNDRCVSMRGFVLSQQPQLQQLLQQQRQ